MKLASSKGKSQPESAAEMLALSFPPLGLYWPNLQTSSAKQAAFLTLQCREAFFGGAAGPGKSDALLAAALMYADVPGYKALILRKTYQDLALPSAIMARSREWLEPHRQAGRVHWADKTYTWTFQSGATLTFGYMDAENDKYRYQGAEMAFVGFDELTQFAETQYEYLFSRMRVTSDVGVPLRMRAASNPGGVGHGWVKKRFISHRNPGVVFIPSRLEDHPDEEYKANYRKNLAELNPVLRAQYERGDWDVAAGLAYEHIDPDVHYVRGFDIPLHWDRFESMDHGTTAPTAWILYAVDEDGNIIVSDLYYRPNTLPDEDAAEILKRRSAWWEKKDPQGWAVRNVCYGDPQSIREKLAQKDDMGQPMTLQDLFLKHGVWVQPANNRRRVGYIAIRQALQPDPRRRFPLWHPKAGQYGSPRLFLCADRCQELIEQLQAAPLADGENDPDRGEAIDAKWERRYGHASAALRYGLLTWNNPSASVDEPEPQTPDEIREQHFQQLAKQWAAKPAQEDTYIYW